MTTPFHWATWPPTDPRQVTTRLREADEIILDTVIRNNLPELYETLRQFPEIGIGGGFVRDYYRHFCIEHKTLGAPAVHDIDLWARDGATAARVVAWLSDSSSHQTSYGYKPMIDNVNWRKSAGIVEFRFIMDDLIPVQMIHAYPFTHASDLVTRFDFTICQATLSYAPDRARLVSVVSTEFEQDMADRVLRYAEMHDHHVGGPAGALQRAFRFSQQGYTVDQKSLAILLARACKRIKYGKASLRILEREATWERFLEQVEDYQPESEPIMEPDIDLELIGRTLDEPEQDHFQ